MTEKKSQTKKGASNKKSPATHTDVMPLTGKIKKNKHFSMKFLREQLENLLILRERISGEILSISLNSLSSTERDPSVSDQGTDTFDREFALNQLGSEQEVLNEIDSAIRRLENGTYGICEISGEVINQERLQALPYARYTIKTQSELEKGQTKYRAFGSTFH